MNVSPENLTADEAAFVANYVEHWRKINAHFVSEYERRMDRRQGVCISGCDPTPYTMPTDERLTANAMEEVALQRQVARLKPQQYNLDRIADVIDAKLSRAVGDVLRNASPSSTPPSWTLWPPCFRNCAAIWPRPRTWRNLWAKS